MSQLLFTQNEMTYALILGHRIDYVKPPYFLSSYPDGVPAITKRLPSPFEKYVITSEGNVFWLDSKLVVVPIKYKLGRPYVELASLKIKKKYFLDKLMVHVFYGIPFNKRIKIEYQDDDFKKITLRNLITYNGNIRIPDYEYDEHEYFPIH